MTLRDRVRNGAAYAVDTGGLSGGNGKSPYDRYPDALRPDQGKPLTLRQRIAARGETPDVEYMGG